MVTVSAFAHPIYKLDSSGHLPENSVFEQWLEDAEVDLLDKVHRIALLLPKGERAHRGDGWKTSVSWLRNPEVPLLAKVAVVFAIILVGAAALFAIALLDPSVALAYGLFGLLGGIYALCEDLSKPSVIQIQEEHRQQIALWAEVVQAIGGLETYYRLPVFTLPDHSSLRLEDLPSPIVKGIDLDRPFIALRLKDQTDQRLFSLVLRLDPSSLRLHTEVDSEEGYAFFQKWGEIYRSAIPKADKDRYIENLPSYSPENDVLLATAFAQPQEQLLATLRQIVQRNHPRFELME